MGPWTVSSVMSPAPPLSAGVVRRPGASLSRKVRCRRHPSRVSRSHPLRAMRGVVPAATLTPTGTTRGEETTMPGLLRGVARTAVVAGTATAVSGRVQRRQAEKYASRDAQIYADREQAYEAQQAPAQPAPPPAAPAAPSTAEVIDQLKELAALKDAGVLTEAEFAAQKAKILGS